MTTSHCEPPPSHRTSTGGSHPDPGRILSHSTVYTGTDPFTPAPRPNTTRSLGSPTRRTPIAPSREVVEATEFLLTQPDAYLFRRRYLELITRTPGPDGTSTPDYTAAERYLLATAKTLRRTLPRQPAEAQQKHEKPDTPPEPA